MGGTIPPRSESNIVRTQRAKAAGTNPRYIQDAELIEDDEYAGFGESAVERVKALLGRLDSVRVSQDRGSTVKAPAEKLFHKFMEQLESIFDSLPRPTEWRSFYNNDLPLLTKIDPSVREWAIANKLNKSQTKENEGRGVKTEGSTGGSTKRY